MKRQKKKKGASVPISAPLAPREVAPGGPSPRPYPSAWDALRSDEVRALVEGAVRIAAGAGLLALSAQLVGCAEPTCSSSRLEELKVHGEFAYQDLVDNGNWRAAREELGYGTGVTSHPPFGAGMIAGGIAMVVPTLPAPATPGGPYGDVLEAKEQDESSLAGVEIVDDPE